MKVNLWMVAIFMGLVTSMALAGEGRLYQAREMKASDWERALRSGETSTIEFRQGDRIPLTLKAEGDLLETTEERSVPLAVKRRFLIRVEARDLLISLNGTDFESFRDRVGAR